MGRSAHLAFSRVNARAGTRPPQSRTPAGRWRAARGRGAEWMRVLFYPVNCGAARLMQRSKRSLKVLGGVWLAAVKVTVALTRCGPAL